MLIQQIQAYYDSLEDTHEKKSFWASDVEKPLFDLYHSFIGTKPTNPPDAEKMMMFTVGKMTEVALVETFLKMGLVATTEQEHIQMEREGIPISGYIDVQFTDGVLGEIKSYYGDYQSRELEAGKPKLSYLKQLAVYMDFKQATTGKLIYIHRGTGEMFEFILERVGTIFTCRDIVFDITETYRRWAKLYNENILPKVEPKSEYRYKIPLATIDWRTLSKSDIQKARNNQKVIGDGWQVQYSNYKDLLLAREGVQPGYTEAELQLINEATTGYTTWSK